MVSIYTYIVLFMDAFIHPDTCILGSLRIYVPIMHVFVYVIYTYFILNKDDF
jgi:hypothetical protein